MGGPEEEHEVDFPQKAKLIYGEICSHIDSKYSMIPSKAREVMKLSIKSDIKKAKKSSKSFRHTKEYRTNCARHD